MIVQSPGKWQPPLLARPSHGLLARHGWLWLAVPGGGLIVIAVVASALGPTSSTGTRAALIGYAVLIGAALLVIGLPIRALVVRAHRRHRASDVALPSLGGVYPGPSTYDTDRWAAPPGDRRSRRQRAVHLAVGTLITAFVVCIFVGVAAIGVGGLVSGIHAMRLQHSSSAVHLVATLDRDTTESGGRDTTYTDHVSYTFAGKDEHDVAISADGAQHSGAPIAVIVDPHHPSDAIATSDHGYEDLIAGIVAILSLVIISSFRIVGHYRRRRR